MFWYIVIILFTFVIYSIIKLFKPFERFENEKKYLDGIDIIYWINLERSPDRKKNMEEMFQDSAFSGILNERIIGVDGKKDKIYDMIQVSKHTANDSEYGCLLSHLNAIKKFNESSYEISLILEDDCTLEFKKYWKKSVKEIIQDAPTDWEIIMLSYTDLHNLTDWTKAKDYTLNQTNLYSTLSYIINKKGAKKIVADCENLSCYKDKVYLLNTNEVHVADIYIYKNAITYCYKYPMFISRSNNESTIHAEHLDVHEKSKQIIIDQYEKMIE